MRLLIAEDSEPFRKRLSQTLSQIAGVEIVGSAENGAQAIEAARILRPDVAIVDIQMPGVNGLEVLRDIRRDLDGLVVIVLTNHSESHYEQKSLELGANYFLLKSAGAAELSCLITELASGRNKQTR